MSSGFRPLVKSTLRTENSEVGGTEGLTSPQCDDGPIGNSRATFQRRSIAPEDQQARATWLQEAMKRISCVLQIHNTPIIAKCNGTI